MGQRLPNFGDVIVFRLSLPKLLYNHWKTGSFWAPRLREGTPEFWRPICSDMASLPNMWRRSVLWPLRVAFEFKNKNKNNTDKNTDKTKVCHVCAWATIIYDDSHVYADTGRTYSAVRKCGMETRHLMQSYCRPTMRTFYEIAEWVFRQNNYTWLIQWRRVHRVTSVKPIQPTRCLLSITNHDERPSVNSS